VAGGAGVDPDVGPGGRNHERADALENPRIRDAPGLGVEIDEAFARAPAADRRCAADGL